jgi:hypothetical protein
MAPAKVGAILQPSNGKLFARIIIWLYRLLAEISFVLQVHLQPSLLPMNAFFWMDFFVVNDLALGCAAISTGIYLNNSTLFKTA